MDQLIFFPEIYPDEDFRSVIYRYHIRSGNAEFVNTKKELFDIKSYKLGLFPRNLSYFFKKLPENYIFEVDEILSHTWFPLFRMFLSKQKISHVINDLMYGKTGTSNYVGRVGIQKVMQVLSKEIKYCLLCMEEDYLKYGETYVHLKHQMEFLNFCHKHREILKWKCPQCGKHFSDQASGVLITRPCCKNNNYDIVENSLITAFQIKFLNDLIFLKEQGSISHEYLYMKFLLYLRKKGYINNQDRIDRLRLFDDLTKNYEKICPSLVLVFREYFLENQRIWYLFHPEKMPGYILIYVLLMLFLAGSVKEFIKGYDDINSIPLPFGRGPWSCNNNICPSFLKKTIKKCKRKSVKQVILGRFICPVCGFEYQKKHFKADMENINKEDFIEISKGHLWERKVMELFHSNYEIKDIAKCLRSSKSAVKSFLSTTSYKEDVKKDYRNKIITLIESDKGLNRSTARRICHKEFTWLLKNDSEWLKKNLPVFALDYSRIDSELQGKVRVISKKLYDSNPLNRIRKYTILNNLETKDKNHFIVHKEKLPKTLAELELHIETIENYQIRHIPIIYSQFIAKGRKERVTYESILSMYKSYKNCTEETKKRIEMVLDKLQKGYE